MKIISVCPNSFAANTYLLICNGKALVVDPAVSVDAIERLLGNENAELCGILLTHGHFDHTISVDTLRNRFDIPLMVHKEDVVMLTDGKINGFFDFYGKECVHRPADKTFVGADEISLGNEKIKIVSTPGHSRGSSCFLCTDEEGKNFLITGDTLFSNSIGRCDLYGGNEAEMNASLKLLASFDGDMDIFPGHGPSCKLSSALEIARYYTDF